MPLGTDVGLGPGDFVLDGDQAPQFSAHACGGQMAGWIKMLLGMQVDLSPSHIVLDGDPAPSPLKGAQRPLFGPCLLWPNGRPHLLVHVVANFGADLTSSIRYNQARQRLLTVSKQFAHNLCCLTSNNTSLVSDVTLKCKRDQHRTQTKMPM